MSAPIKEGDVCQVIAGLGRSKSPNIGKTVIVVHRIYGDISQFFTRLFSSGQPMPGGGPCNPNKANNSRYADTSIASNKNTACSSTWAAHEARQLHTSVGLPW